MFRNNEAKLTPIQYFDLHAGLGELNNLLKKDEKTYSSPAHQQVRQLLEKVDFSIHAAVRFDKVKSIHDAVSKLMPGYQSLVSPQAAPPGGPSLDSIFKPAAAAPPGGLSLNSVMSIVSPPGGLKFGKK